MFINSFTKARHPTLSQINPVYAFPVYFFKTHFNITL